MNQQEKKLLTKKLMKLCQENNEEKLLAAFAEAEQTPGTLSQCAETLGSSKETLLHQLIEYGSKRVIQSYMDYVDHPTLKNIISFPDWFDHTPLYVLASPRLDNTLAEIFELFLAFASKEIMSRELTRVVDTSQTAIYFRGYYKNEIASTRPRSAFEAFLNVGVEPNGLLEFVNDADLIRLVDETELLAQLRDECAEAIINRLDTPTIEMAMLRVSKIKSGNHVPMHPDDEPMKPSIVRLLELERIGPKALKAIANKNVALDVWYKNIFTMESYRLSHFFTSAFVAGQYTAPLALVPLIFVAAENMMGVNGTTVSTSPSQPAKQEQQEIILEKLLDMAIASLTGNNFYNLEKIYNLIKVMNSSATQSCKQKFEPLMEQLRVDCQQQKSFTTLKLKILTDAAKRELPSAVDALAALKAHKAEWSEEVASELKPLVKKASQSDDEDNDSDEEVESGFVIIRH